MIKTKSLVGIIMLLIIMTTGLATAYASHGGSVGGEVVVIVPFQH